MIKMYSTHCPQCNVLETKLNKKNIQYEICDDMTIMKELGFKSVPVLDVDGEIKNFSEAIKWVNAQ